MSIRTIRNCTACLYPLILAVYLLMRLSIARDHLVVPLHLFVLGATNENRVLSLLLEIHVNTKTIVLGLFEVLGVLLLNRRLTIVAFSLLQASQRELLEVVDAASKVGLACIVGVCGPLVLVLVCLVPPSLGLSQEVGHIVLALFIVVDSLLSLLYLILFSDHEVLLELNLIPILIIVFLFVFLFSIQKFKISVLHGF